MLVIVSLAAMTNANYYLITSLSMTLRPNQLDLKQLCTALDAIRIDNFDNLSNVQLANQCDDYVARIVMAISHLHNTGLNQTTVNFNGQQTIVRRFDENELLRCLFILQHISDGLRRGILVAKRGILYYYMHRLGKDVKDSFPNALKRTINGIGIPAARLYSTEPTTKAYGDLCFTNVETRVKYDLLEREHLDLSILKYSKWKVDRVGQIKRIIVVEKATLFRQIIQTDFHKKMDAIIITDGGFSTSQGRAWLRNFREWLRIDENECYGVGDYGPYGYSVLHSFGYAKDPIKSENIFRTRLKIVVTHSLMTSFPEARNAENTKFSEADLNIFKFLFDEKNEFFKNNRNVRTNQLIKMYKGKFKCDVDLLDIEKLLEAVKRVIELGIVM